MSVCNLIKIQPIKNIYIAPFMCPGALYRITYGIEMTVSLHFTLLIMLGFECLSNPKSKYCKESPSKQIVTHYYTHHCNELCTTLEVLKQLQQHCIKVMDIPQRINSPGNVTELPYLGRQKVFIHPGDRSHSQFSL